MATRRCIYIIALAGATTFYALYPYWFSGYLFAVMLMLIPFDLIISLPGMLTRRLKVASPEMLEQGAEGNLVFTTVQTRPFPARCLKIRLHLLGDEYSAPGKRVRQIICGARNDSRYEFPISTKHSGVIAFEFKFFQVVSLVGLFSLPVKAQRRISVLILPAPVKPPHISSLPRGVVFTPKPGGGFAEDHDLRPYRQGDPIRNIHWKLSAKADELITREPLVPPPHSRLVEAALWTGARQRDLVLGRLRWVSDYLLKWEMPFFVRIGQDGPVSEIVQEADLINYIIRVFDRAAHTPASIPLPSGYSWIFRIDGREPENNAGAAEIDDITGQDELQVFSLQQ